MAMTASVGFVCGAGVLGLVIAIVLAAIKKWYEKDEKKTKQWSDYTASLILGSISVIIFFIAGFMYSRPSAYEVQRMRPVTRGPQQPIDPGRNR